MNTVPKSWLDISALEYDALEYDEESPIKINKWSYGVDLNIILRYGVINVNDPIITIC